MTLFTFFGLAAIGLFAGVASGLFGIGGGILIVPSLVYLLGYSQKLAIGTSLAVLLPPVGIAAAVEYYRHGNVDLVAALVIAVCLLAGGWLGAYLSNQWSPGLLKILFGGFVTTVGLYILRDGFR